MRYAVFSALTFFIFIFLPGLGHGATIQVPTDQATIQEAIDVAATGDLILVAAGTYTENLDFLGKAITVQSVSGAATTVIDGSAPVDPVYTSVVTFKSGEGLDSVLDGFTLTGGTGYLVEFGLGLYIGYGGGIFCDGVSPTIIHCIIRKNPADYGGGILCQNGAAPLIEGNILTENDLETNARGGGICCLSASSPTIRNNSIQSNKGFAGGGIYCEDGSSPLIEGNDISGNDAFFWGGGIACLSGSSPTIFDNLIEANEVTSGVGGGIYCDDHSSPVIDRCVVSGNFVQFGACGLYAYNNCSPQISNCLFTENTAQTTNGGALFFSTGGTPTITNCTVSGNIASNQGGAISCYSDVILTIVNSVFWEDEAPILGKEIYIGHDQGARCHVTINYCDLQGGLSSVYVQPGSILVWGDEMIDEDPRFADVLGDDYHLTGRSPCVNRGDDAAAPAEDIDGDLRPYMGAADMGADEYLGPHPLQSDVFALSVTGGLVDFTLQAGFENAGRYYLVLGSMHGNAPGLPLPGGLATLPINWDGFTDFVVARINSGLFQNFLGILAGAGAGAARISAPAVHPSKIGQVMHFAYLLDGAPLWDYASNPIPVEFVP